MYYNRIHYNNGENNDVTKRPYHYHDMHGVTFKTSFTFPAIIVILNMLRLTLFIGEQMVKIIIKTAMF